MEVVDTVYQLSDTTFVVNTVKLISENTNNSILNAQNIIALCISVRYNRKTLRLTKEQNILSNKPLLTSFYEKDLINNTFSIKVQNNGLGPALIQDISFNWKTLKNITFFKLIKSEDIKKEVGILTFNYKSRDIKDIWVSDKSEFNIFSGKIIKPILNRPKRLFNILGEVEINVNYQDIYGNSYVLKEILDPTKIKIVEENV